MAFDPEKPVQTRDGRKARILCADRSGTDLPIIALREARGIEIVETYAADGTIYGTGTKNDLDLINIPEKRVYERWVNVYPDNISWSHRSRVEADGYQKNGRIACIHIKQTYTPGEGLEPAE